MSALNEHGDTALQKLQAQVDYLQRQVDNARTDWLCNECHGKGCEAERQNAVLLAELENLQRENAALRADKERLDWIARNRHVSAAERPWSVTPSSLRESIDAARKEAKP